MNNEQTLLNPAYAAATQEDANNATQQTATSTKSGKDENVIPVFAGALVGAGVTTAGNAVAATIDEKLDEQIDEVEEVAEGQAEVVAAEEPEVAVVSEEAVVATSSGVRVAHVDDGLSFSQAFAAAREQVGPGGVFEWHGQAYSTYYENEWDQMSAEERAQFQASIDYHEVLSDDATAQHYNDVAQQNLHDQAVTDVEPETAQEPTVNVLEVGTTDLNGDGVPENAALLEIEGEELIILDIDNDDKADIAITETGDAYDISGEGIPMPAINEFQDTLPEDVPDYMNDADVGYYEA